MGRPRKPADRRQNRATRNLDDELVEAELVPLAVVPAGEPPPAPDRGWLAATRADWTALWSSGLVAHYQEQDLPELRRCFGWRDELARVRRKARALRRAAEAELLVEGSKGQPVANPLFDVADKLEAQALAIEPRIVQLEDRLGLSPKARLGLGVSQQKGMNLAGQNALLAQRIEEAMRDGDDPRTNGSVAEGGDAAVSSG